MSVVFTDLAERSTEIEILDGDDVAEEIRERCYDDLTRMHWWLGNHAAVLKRLRRDGDSVKTVLDIGCAYGGLLRKLEAELGVKALGIDLNPPKRRLPLTIIRADAVRDLLPPADAAVCVATLHHFPAEDVAALIRNVGRSCRRFIILDSVRHWIPMALFRAFVAPFVSRVTVLDGIRSVQRSYTPEEMRELVAKTLAGTPARFRHVVAPLYRRQIVDIEYESVQQQGVRIAAGQGPVKRDQDSVKPMGESE
jgi:2-polyprenyl-3-methyl-5-hydroxy-6-metoxy-1,4-benzoquinol methylase